MIVLSMITILLIFFSGYFLTKKFIRLEEYSYVSFLLFQIGTGISFLVIVYYYIDTLRIYSINYQNSFFTNISLLIIFVILIASQRINLNNPFKYNAIDSKKLFLTIIIVLIFTICLTLLIPKIFESQKLYELDTWRLSGDTKNLMEYGTYQHNPNFEEPPLYKLKPNGIVYIVSLLAESKDNVFHFFKYTGIIILPLTILSLIILVKQINFGKLKKRSLLYLGYALSAFIPITSFVIFRRLAIGGVLTMISLPLFILVLVMLFKYKDLKNSIIGFSIILSGIFLISLYTFYILMIIIITFLLSKLFVNNIIKPDSNNMESIKIGIKKNLILIITFSIIFLMLTAPKTYFWFFGDWNVNTEISFQMNKLISPAPGYEVKNNLFQGFYQIFDWIKNNRSVPIVALLIIFLSIPSLFKDEEKKYKSNIFSLMIVVIVLLTLVVFRNKIPGFSFLIEDQQVLRIFDFLDILLMVLFISLFIVYADKLFLNKHNLKVKVGITIFIIILFLFHASILYNEAYLDKFNKDYDNDLFWVKENTNISSNILIISNSDIFNTIFYGELSPRKLKFMNILNEDIKFKDFDIILIDKKTNFGSFYNYSIELEQLKVSYPK